MTSKQAIQKALKVGWDDTNYAFTTDVANAARPNVKWEYGDRVFLDPLFWQSLGKALGWTVATDYRPHRKGSHSDDWGGYGDDFPCDCDRPHDWKGQWHRFIDHLAEGGTAETFFETLT